jgi:UDP-2,3-diacylglucosamine pyrophosphatase LpxH
MAKRLIFSDLHFGDPFCSLYSQPVVLGLRSFLRGLGTVDELILAGDVLDANVSSLHRAIEGRKNSGAWPKQIGFRNWLAYLFEDNKFNCQRVIYIPGNHDYIIWNILSTNKAFVEPISQGLSPTGAPLTEGTFPEPFIRGVAPEGIRERFSVSYPDYEFSLQGHNVLVTHGHYLDETQTLFKTLRELIKKEKGNRAEAVAKFFKVTAQYQAVANAVSYMKDSRDFVEIVYRGLGSLLEVVGKLRDQPIDAKMLEAIEMYLYYFRQKEPDVFIFGHTHEAAHTNTAAFGRDKSKRLIGKVIDVWNDGSFIKSKSTRQAGTFIAVDDTFNSPAPVQLLKVDSKGTVTEMNV